MRSQRKKRTFKENVEKLKEKHTDKIRTNRKLQLKICHTARILKVILHTVFHEIFTRIKRAGSYHYPIVTEEKEFPKVC